MYEKAGVIAYQHIKVFDNKFNSTRICDTLDVAIFRLDNDKTGFRIVSKAREWFFDSNELTVIDHSNKTRSTEQPEDINDAAIWSKNLLGLLDSLSGKACALRLIDHALCPYVSYELRSKSSVDSGQTLINAFEYTFPGTVTDAFSHKETVVRDKDTLQIQTHFFKKIRFQPTETYEATAERMRRNSYEILKDDADLPWGKEPVREGDQLTQKTFIDMENNSVQIINNERKYALIVFSFIGCSPCERAIGQLKEDKLGWRDKINLYYSSFQNNNAAVKKYLQDKKIFRNAFGMESNMIHAFRLPVSPTFVLMDANGNIRKIIEGYDESVLAALNEAIGSAPAPG